jgi:hypothetical protein
MCDIGAFSADSHFQLETIPLMGMTLNVRYRAAVDVEAGRCKQCRLRRVGNGAELEMIVQPLRQEVDRRWQDDYIDGTIPVSRIGFGTICI